MELNNDSAGKDRALTLTRALYGLGGLSVPALAHLDRAIADAYRARADAHLQRGEHYLAVADYGRSLRTTPRDVCSISESHLEAKTGLQEAIDKLQCVLHAGESEGLPTGYLLVAEGGGVVAVYPPTEAGCRAAIGHADKLSRIRDKQLRLEDIFLAEADEFDMVVYECDGKRTVEVYRVPPEEFPWLEAT